MDTILSLLQLPLYLGGCYVAGLLAMLPGMILAKGLEGAYPKWQAHVGIVVLGFIVLSLWFGAKQGLV